jgi:hypothetical protein
MDLQATAVPGLVLTTVLMAAWLVEIACGHSGSPNYWLAAPAACLARLLSCSSAG